MTDETETSVCKREGCDRALAYDGAEYCGGACSAQRREPKTPESEAQLAEAVEALAARPRRTVTYEGIKKAFWEALGVKAD